MYRQLFSTCAFHGPPSGIQVSLTHSFTEQKIWRQAGFEEMLVSLSKRDQSGMGGLQKRERFLMCIIFMNILMSKIRKRDQSWWRSAKTSGTSPGTADKPYLLSTFIGCHTDTHNSRPNQSHEGHGKLLRPNISVTSATVQNYSHENSMSHI